MPDISQTLVAKSDQLNGDDLIGGPRTITVRGVKVNGDDQPVAISYEGDKNKPYKPCLSMRRVLAHAWGNQSEAWVGRSMTLYRNASVKFGDLEVGGIRISHLSDLRTAKVQVPLTATKGRKVGYTVERLGEAPEPEERPQIASGPEVDALRDKAREAAQQGTVTFREWWGRADVKPHRAALQPILVELQAIAAAADERGAPTEADPWTPGDDTPDADERQPGEEG